MTNDSAKASVTEIDFGFAKIEGLMLSNGSYAVSGVQANNVLKFATHPNYIVRSLKSLLGEEFEPITSKTETSNKGVTVITTSQFAKLVIQLTKRGNEIAAAFAEALVEEGIERRFDIAFKKVVEEEIRNARLKARIEGILHRNFWTDAIDKYLDTHEVSADYLRFIYPNVSNVVNLGVFGMKAQELREKLKLKPNQATRDHIPPEALPEIAFIEKYAGTLVKKGVILT